MGKKSIKTIWPTSCRACKFAKKTATYKPKNMVIQSAASTGEVQQELTKFSCGKATPATPNILQPRKSKSPLRVCTVTFCIPA